MGYRFPACIIQKKICVHRNRLLVELRYYLKDICHVYPIARALLGFT